MLYASIGDFIDSLPCEVRRNIIKNMIDMNAKATVTAIPLAIWHAPGMSPYKPAGFTSVPVNTSPDEELEQK